MFEALIVTLREGIEAALVVGIIVAYLRKTGREALSRWVYLGLAAGIAASACCAAIFSRLGVDEEAYEGWLMIAGAIFVATMVIWMLRASKGLKGHIESRVEAVAAAGTRPVAAGLFLLTFVLILREGIETVLFLAAVSFTTDGLLTFLGGAIGLGVALLFGVSFVRGTARVDVARFFKVTSIVLLVFALQLVIGGIHEFGERGTIPIGRREMLIIGPIVKNEVVFFISILVLPLIVLLVPGRAEKKRSAAALALEGPERRLALAKLRREKLWRRTLASAGILVVASLSVSFAFSRLPRGIDPPKVLTETPGGEVRIPTSGLDDGHLHRFGVPIGGAIVRFFVMKSGPRLVPAFDACQVCGAYGYIETKGRLVCLACAADINPATLGIGGGCNPLPLAFAREGEDLVIHVSDLAKEIDAFKAAEAVQAQPPTR